MARAATAGPRDRKSIIADIEKARGSKVLAYVTGDRPNGPGAMIGEDAVRPMYDHLLSIAPDGHVDKIDLFLYSRGGNVSVPWRIVTMIREFCDSFSVLIPYKAHSAATMVSLGTDQIVMGRKAELGPIDPTLSRVAQAEGTVPPPEISVEDVSSYVSFMRDRAGITDQSALSSVVSQLAEHLTPLTLGSVNRQYSHIRLVARKLVMSHQAKTDEEKVAAIVDALTEKMYSHGHAIGRNEASELGLPVLIPEQDLERLLWELYLSYEAELKLCEPFDPDALLAQANSDTVTLADEPFALLESVSRLDIHKANVEVRRQRKVPPNPQINVNVQLGLPPALDPNNPQVQQVVQQVLQAAGQALPQLIQAEIARQSPIVGIQMRAYGGSWRKV